MMRAWLALAVAGALVALSPLAHAQPPAQKAPAAEKAPHDRVHLGATSVTVVDEHETVDDVITRLRSAKDKSATATKTKSGQTVPPPAATTAPTQHQDGRATLKRERESAAAHTDAERLRDDRRERAASTRLRSEKKPRR